MIFTFYSYKGGVGRSMALANVGRWLQLQGLKVVMIDWDLEAPGLESFFFDGSEREALRAKLGLLDVLVAYKEIFPSLPRPLATAPAAGDRPAPAASRTEQMVAILNDALSPFSHVFAPLRKGDSQGTAGGTLSLVPAGRRDASHFDGYAEMVQRFDWAEFYAEYEGEAFFEWMRRQLRRPEVADVVLIDSRTGVAEMSGVCTRQLADAVVIFCAPNDQNLDGVAMMANSFVRPDLLEARQDRPIELVMVPARIDVTEGRPLDLFLARFRSKLNSYLPPVFRGVGTDFDRLRIPYIREYAFAERLAVGEPDGVKGLQDAYVLLSTHLALLAPPDSEMKRRCREALQNAFGMPTAIVAHLDELDAELAADVCRRLESAGVLTLPLGAGDLDGLVERAPKGRGAATPVPVLVLALRRDLLLDPKVRQVWRRAREQGIPLHLVMTGSPRPGRARLPRWLEGVRLYDPSRDWSDLLHEVQTPRDVQRAPFLAPPMPAQFFGRVEELRRAKEILFSTTPDILALVGMGGSGKTSLARVICNDDEVIDQFSDGILWASLGGDADVGEALAKLVIAFEGGTKAPLDAAEAERRLAEHLSKKRCLLVLDDVYEAGQVERLRPREFGTRLIITTRSRDVALKMSAVEIRLGALDGEHARQVLLRDVATPASESAAASSVVDGLEGSPLALALANARLRARIREGESPSQALAGLDRRLNDEGLSAIDPGQSNDPSTSIAAAFTLAMERLDPEDRARLPNLASLPASPIDAETVARATALPRADAEQMLRRLAAQNLVDFDASRGAVRIPALTRAFARTVQVRQQRAEMTRVALATPTAFNVYLSYRREDSGEYAGRIYDRLTQKFGFDQVFMDVRGLSAGQDFVEVIREKVASANAMVVLLGRSWIGAARDAPRPDFVGMEVAEAFQRGLPVIPVLVGGAQMPLAEELPEALSPLARRIAVKVSDTRFNQDVDLLIEAIGQLMRQQPAAPAAARPTTPRAPPGVSVGASMSVASFEIDNVRIRPEAPPRERSARRVRYWVAATVAAAAAIVILPGLIIWGTAGVSTRDAGIGSPTLNERDPGVPIVEALFASGEDYELGRSGVKQDYAKAAEMYRKAADANFAPALNALGRLYENGLGVPADRAKAIELYGKAAALGHPDAKAALLRLELRKTMKKSL